MALSSLVLAGVLISSAASAPLPVSSFDVTWTTPTPFDGKNYADAMPAGNGDVVVLAWGNATAGGLDAYIRSPRAMHTDATHFTIARLHVEVSPNPFKVGSYYNQTHHLQDGSIVVQGGGSGPDDYTASLTLMVDANAPVVLVSVASRDGVTPLSLTAALTSVRAPTGVTSYQLPFHCNASSVRPDGVSAAPLPAPAPAGSVALWHTNSIADGDPDYRSFSFTLQGLASLLPRFPDPLDGRIFGAGMLGGAGADGAGAALLRTSPTTLVSAAPAPAFLVQVHIRTDEGARGDEAAWLHALAAQMAAGPPPAARIAASAAWWRDFWARSYIAVGDGAGPGAPARVGVFPCGGSNAPGQVLTLNATTGEVRLPGGACFAASGDGVVAAPCAGAKPWLLTPCTAKGCGAGDMWVRQGAEDVVLGIPGATCPWLDTWSIDDPTGVEKNELWAWSLADGTLRTLCKTCPQLCVTAVAGDAPPSLSAQYARTRFVQAVQSRNAPGTSAIPIPFNGMLFTNMAGCNGPNDVDYRQWGPDSWWQNTRLPYGAMLAAGDFDTMRVILDWAASFLPLALARTALLLPGEKGVFFTETVNVFGLYQDGEVSCSPRPANYPVWLEGPGSTGGWVRFDFGGNALGPEAGLMALDYYLHTGDADAAARYIPIATATLDFYSSHYPNRTADGKLLLWPTQVLETYWCVRACCLPILTQRVSNSVPLLSPVVNPLTPPPPP